MIFYKESKSKKKQKFFRVAGEGATRVSEWILLKKNPNPNFIFGKGRGGGGGGWGG